MRARRAQGGFTLIEILIALVVLVVGVVGVVSVFPVGIANTVDATGDTIAANLAESVHAALVAAHRNVVIPPAAPGSVAPPARVVLIHDLHPGNKGTGRYEYELPPTPLTTAALTTEANGIAAKQLPYCHPDPTKAGGADVFTLATDPYIGETTRSVRMESDPTESYSFYSFRFYVRKVPTIPIGGNSGLYEYTIYVFRVPGRGPLQPRSGSTVPMGPRFPSDPPPGIVTIPLKPAPAPPNTPAVPFWIMTARISGP